MMNKPVFFVKENINFRDSKNYKINSVYSPSSPLKLSFKKKDRNPAYSVSAQIKTNKATHTTNTKRWRQQIVGKREAK